MHCLAAGSLRALTDVTESDVSLPVRGNIPTSGTCRADHGTLRPDLGTMKPRP